MSVIATKPWLLTGGTKLRPPALALNFMQPGALEPRVTFTRTSTATYFDGSGTMQTAAANAPRWDYDPVTHALRGLLIEEARTNSWLQSGNAANAAWALESGGGPTLPVVTANQTLAPDGTLTAARVVYPVVSIASSYSHLYQGITVSAAAYTFSVYLKGNVGGEQLYIAQMGIVSNAPRITLTTQWQRFSFTTGTLAAGTTFFMVGADLRDTSETSTPAQTVFVWGGQIEQGAFPTSYIPTTAAAVARVADFCYVSNTNSGYYVPPGGSWFAEFISLVPVASNMLVVGYTGAGAKLELYCNGNFMGEYDVAAVVQASNAITPNTVSKSASTWAPTLGRICANGGPVAVSAALTGGFSDAAAWGIAFLQSGGASGGLTGYIRAVRYWSRILSDAEMQNVTR